MREAIKVLVMVVGAAALLWRLPPSGATRARDDATCARSPERSAEV